MLILIYRFFTYHCSSFPPLLLGSDKQDIYTLAIFIFISKLVYACFVRLLWPLFRQRELLRTYELADWTSLHLNSLYEPANEVV